MKYTREQLEGMSNLELSLALCGKLGYDVYSYTPCNESEYPSIVIQDGAKYIPSFVLDQWDCIMPLAIKYNIVLSPAQDAPDTEWYADRIFSDELESCWCDDKPQRAVACVLLLMEGL